MSDTIERAVENVRHYLHLQIGKPLKPELASAPEIALDQLKQEAATAIASLREERDRLIEAVNYNIDIKLGLIRERDALAARCLELQECALKRNRQLDEAD